MAPWGSETAMDEVVSCFMKEYNAMPDDQKTQIYDMLAEYCGKSSTASATSAVNVSNSVELVDVSGSSTSLAARDSNHDAGEAIVHSVTGGDTSTPARCSTSSLNQHGGVLSDILGVHDTLVVVGAPTEVNAFTKDFVDSPNISKRGVDSSTRARAFPIQTMEREGDRREMEVDEFIDGDLGASRPRRAPPRQPRPRRPRRAPPRAPCPRHPWRAPLCVPRLRRPRRAPLHPPWPRRPRRAPLRVPRLPPRPPWPRRPRRAPLCVPRLPPRPPWPRCPRRAPSRPIRPPHPPWRDKHLLHGNNFTNVCGHEKADLDSHLRFDNMMRRYINPVTPALSVGIVLFGAAIHIPGDCKLLGKVADQNSVMLEPLHAHVLDKGPGASQLCFCFGPWFSFGWGTGQQRSPWPPPMQSKMQDTGVQFRPQPWPSFQYWQCILLTIPQPKPCMEWHDLWPQTLPASWPSVSGQLVRNYRHPWQQIDNTLYQLFIWMNCCDEHNGKLKPWPSLKCSTQDFLVLKNYLVAGYRYSMDEIGFGISKGMGTGVKLPLTLAVGPVMLLPSPALVLHVMLLAMKSTWLVFLYGQGVVLLQLESSETSAMQAYTEENLYGILYLLKSHMILVSPGSTHYWNTCAAVEFIFVEELSQEQPTLYIVHMQSILVKLQIAYMVFIPAGSKGTEFESLSTGHFLELGGKMWGCYCYQVTNLAARYMHIWHGISDRTPGNFNKYLFHIFYMALQVNWNSLSEGSSWFQSQQLVSRCQKFCILSYGWTAAANILPYLNAQDRNAQDHGMYNLQQPVRTTEIQWSARGKGFNPRLDHSANVQVTACSGNDILESSYCSWYCKFC